MHPKFLLKIPWDLRLRIIFTIWVFQSVLINRLIILSIQAQISRKISCFTSKPWSDQNIWALSISIFTRKRFGHKTSKLFFKDEKFTWKFNVNKVATKYQKWEKWAKEDNI